jgi:hypothetical protein
MPLEREQFVEIARRHAFHEGAGDIEGVMATLDPEPEYRFYPLGLGFRGTAQARRFYEVFVREVRPQLLGYAVHGEWLGDSGLAQEYSIDARTNDGTATTYRVLSILMFGQNGLSGECLYASEAFFRFLAGSMWNELQPV